MSAWPAISNGFPLDQATATMGTTAVAQSQWLNAWVFQFLFNLIGYASVLVPGYIILQLLKKSHFAHKAGGGWCRKSVRLFVEGSPNGPLNAKGTPVSTESTSLWKQCVTLSISCSGLLGSYVFWGLLQERIMAIEYQNEDGTAVNFRNSLFLEFMNRFLAVFVAVSILVTTRQPTHRAPIYMYSYNAFSNVMSSWFQYEALKYVSFPVQVLAKASKVIPVMLMSRIISKKSYTALEYMTALMISVGLFLFLINSEDSVRVRSHDATVSGIILMCGYLLFDTFTVNWQGKLYHTYQMSSIQMMAGSNFFSILFSSVSLLEQGGFQEAYAFMCLHPTFILHIALLSLTSTIGQLFIYYTIQKFGAVTFTIIMTVRQAVSILLSCIFFQHTVHFIGLVGLVICFGAIFFRIYHTTTKGNHKTVEVVNATSSTVK